MAGFLSGRMSFVDEELSLTLFVWGLDVCLSLEVFILELALSE